MQPQRWQPTRLPCPWDSPGKNTGVGCHFLLQCVKLKRENEVTQLCPSLSDPMDCSLPDSSIHGIFQARVLEWGAIAFSGPSLLGTWKSSGQSAEFPFLLGKLEDMTKVFGFCFLTILPSPATCVSQYPRGTHPLTHQVPFLHFKAVFPDSHTVTIQEG